MNLIELRQPETDEVTGYWWMEHLSELYAAERAFLVTMDRWPCRMPRARRVGPPKRETESI
jgi:hypothetical protein